MDSQNYNSPNDDFKDRSFAFFSGLWIGTLLGFLLAVAYFVMPGIDLTH
jgi:hypothetical protein